jgi:protease I
MAEQSAREVVTLLHEYDNYPNIPKVNLHLLATAPGNEHLYAFMSDAPENAERYAGKKIAIIITHGAEEAEISIPKKWFEDRGATVDIVSPNFIDYPEAFGVQWPEVAKTHVLAVQFMQNSGWLPVDARVEEISVDDYDALIVPGGAWNPDQLRVNEAVLQYLRDFQATGKPTGALCHGTQVFQSAGLLNERKCTGYWNIWEDMTNAGAEVLDEPVVVDENVITSRFIYDIPQFVDAIVERLN